MRRKKGNTGATGAAGRHWAPLNPQTPKTWDLVILGRVLGSFCRSSAGTMWEVGSELVGHIYEKSGGAAIRGFFWGHEKPVQGLENRVKKLEIESKRPLEVKSVKTS